ncbi:unnamed protein product [Calypogeia fissa]
MAVNPAPAPETTMEVKPPLGLETKMEVQPPKRSWTRSFMRLFKRKNPDTSSQQLSSEKQTPSPITEGAVETTASSSEAVPIQEAEVQVQVKLQVTPRSGQANPSIELDESKIDGLRSGEGKFMPCLPTNPNNRSNTKNAMFSNVHTLFFSTDHPRSTDVTQTVYNTSKRGKTSRLPCNRRKRIVNHAHGRKTKQGCFPQLSRTRAHLEDPNSSRFTYLHVDEHGNYGQFSEDGSVHSKELTYLEFKEGGRYEPKDQDLKDQEMTYLELDKEGKYESSLHQTESDALAGPPRNTTDANVREGNEASRSSVSRISRVHPRTSITSLESDDESSDIFQSREQLNNRGSLPTTDPSTVLLRQSVTENAFQNNMDFLINAREANDVSNDQGEQIEASLETYHETKVEKGGSTSTVRRGWHPTAKEGSRSNFFSPNEDTPKGTLPSIDLVDKKVDVSSYNQWNDPPNQLNEEDDNLKSRCLRLQPLRRRKVHKSRNDNELGNPLLKNPPDLRQQEMSKAPQNKTADGDLRNGCLGLQPLKYCQQQQPTSTRLEDITLESYNVTDFDEPWKGEEVADFELRDFKRLKSKRKSLPVNRNGKNGFQKTDVAPIGTDQNDDGEHEHDDWSDDETDCEQSKLSKGCLPFGLGSTREYEQVEIISPPLESYTKDDIYRALDKLQEGDYDMDCTGSVTISVDSDDEIHSMEITELDTCSKSNPVPETPWDDSREYQPPTGCLPFGRKLGNLPDVIVGSEEDIDFRIYPQASDPQSFGEEPTTYWDDLNDKMPRTGCFPFRSNEKKDYVGAKLMSTELDSVQSNEPQIEEEADERQCKEFGSNNPKKWCLPFGRQRTDYVELVSTSMDATDTAPGTSRETVDHNLNGEGEDIRQCPLLSDWQEQTRKEETDWFPSNCFSKTLAKSPFDSAETDPNQVRVDLELRDTEMHTCLPCSVRKSRRGKLLYVQSGPSSRNSFEFELDIHNPPMERGDETNGDEDQWHRSRDESLPLDLKSGKEYLLRDSTRKDNDQNIITSEELQGPDSAAEKKTTCAGHVFTVKKLKPTPSQSVARPQNDAQSNAPTVFTTSAAEADLHELPQTGCARFSRKWNTKNLDLRHALPGSGPLSGAALESSNAPSQEKVEETESPKVSRSLWNGKSKYNTGIVDLLSEMSGCNTLDMEERGIRREDSREESGETSCSKFSVQKTSRKNDESVAQSGKTSCGMCWTKQGPVNLEQTTNQSGYATCQKFWMKQDPPQQVEEQSVDQSRTSICGRFRMKQDLKDSLDKFVEASGMSRCSRLLMKKDATNLVEVEVSESGKAESNQEQILKELEDTLAKTQNSYCGKLPVTQDILKQFHQVIEKSRSASCDGLSTRKNSKNEVEVLMDESGRASSSQEHLLKELEVTLAETKSSHCGKLPVTQDILKQFQQVIEKSRRASCDGSSMRKNSKNEVEVLMDKSGRASSSQEHAVKEVEGTLAETKSSQCGKLPVTEDVLKQFKHAIERSRTASCDGLSMRKISKNEVEEQVLKELEDTLAETKRFNCGKLPVTQYILKQIQQAVERSRGVACNGLSVSQNSENEVEVLVDESGSAGSNQEQTLKELEEPSAETKRLNCGKLPVTQDILKQFQQAVDRSRRVTCNGLSVRKNSPNEVEVLVDESGRAGSNQEQILKDLEELLAKTKRLNCGMLPVTQDIFKQFQQAVERSRSTSCDGLSVREISKNELEVGVDESGRASSNQQHILKEVEHTLAGTKSSHCSNFPITQDTLRQFQQAIKRSGKLGCEGLSVRKISENEIEVVVDESGRGSPHQEHILKELEDTLAETKSSYCDKFPMTQDTLRQFRQAIKRYGNFGCDGLSMRKISENELELVVDESGRASSNQEHILKELEDTLAETKSSYCSKFPITQDTVRQFQQAITRSGKVGCDGLSKRKISENEVEVLVDESGRTTCGKLLKKEDASKSFDEEIEGSKARHREKFACLPLIEGERNRCGRVSLTPDPQKQSEEIAQRPEKNLCYDDVFAFKRDPPKGVHSTREIGKGVENRQRNLAEYTRGKISALPGRVCNQRGEATHLNETEVTPLISKGGRSRKGFFKRCCPCMAVSDHSSTGSRCNEAPVMEDSLNINSDLSTDGLMSKIGDCTLCFPQAKINEMVATADTSHTIDCIIQSNIHSLPVSATVRSLDKDPNFEPQRELRTPEGKNAWENSKVCSYGRLPDDFLSDCGICLLYPFAKCASQTKHDEDLKLSVPAESVSLSQRHAEDDQQQPTGSSHRSDRERWTPYLGKDSEPDTLKPFSSTEGPEPPVLATESRSDGQDEYQRSMENEPEPGIRKPFNLRKGPEQALPKKGFKTDEDAPRLYPGAEIRHSCHTFRPYKGAEDSPSEVSSTARKETGENWKHCDKLDSSSLPQSGNCSKNTGLGDTWPQTEWNKVEQERPENKWLRREAREPLAEQKIASAGQVQKDWLQDDDTTSGTQESTSLNNNPHDKWSSYWQKEPLEGDFEQRGKEEKNFTPQNSTDSPGCSEDGWGTNHTTVAATEVFKPPIPPVSLQHERSEFESQNMMVQNPEDDPVVADGYVTYERNPEDEQLDKDCKLLNSNHQCLGQNWQKRQKQESVAEALKASETLLKKLPPLRHPDLESGQAESSSSGLSQNKANCCVMPLFQTKEKRKPKRTHTKEVETQATTYCQQTSKQTANPLISKCQTASVSTKSSRDTFQEENQQRKKQKTKRTRRVRGSSTPVGEFEGRQIHSSRKVRDGDLSASRTFEEKNEPFHESITESEEILDFKDQKSSNWGKNIDLQKSKTLKPTAHAGNNFQTNSCDEPPKTSVDRTRQESFMEDTESQNCWIPITHKKPLCSQQPKVDESKRSKKVSNRPACATKLFAFTRWTSDEDSDRVKHHTYLVSEEKKTSGRKLNTYSSRAKKHSNFGLDTSTTDDSSSDDDIYDVASKRFRDNLFKNKNRDNCGVTESEASRDFSSIQDVVKNYQQKTTENEPFMRSSAGGNVGPILQKFEESDQFCRSPAFKELVAVENQMRDIAKIIRGIAGPDYLDAVKDSEHQIEDGNVTSEDETFSQKGKVSAYHNPTWFAQWKEPVSVQMATRLAGDEVPIYYDEGFQVGYVPVRYRGSKGMRKTKKAEQLNEEYSKFMNQKIKPPPDDEDTAYYENNKDETQPKKRYSQKFTAKRLLHGKLHPHDHRSSGALVQVEAAAPEYSSSSSSWSWKEDLILSHRKVFRKDMEVMSIRKKAPLNGDSDSDDSLFSPRIEMPSMFMGQVDEELARLKIARKQFQEIFQEPIGPTLPYKLENCNKGMTGHSREATHCDDQNVDFKSDDSDLIPVRRLKGNSVKDSIECAKEGNSCLGWADKSVRNSTEDADDDSPRGRQKCFGSNGRSVRRPTDFAEDDSARDGQCVGWMRGCMSREGSPSKAQRALEKEEFQLLERRVRKELGGTRKSASAKAAQHSTKAFNRPLNFSF